MVKTILKIECAWCGKDMGEKDGQGVTGTSHGICQECVDKIDEKLKDKLWMHQNAGAPTADDR